MYNPGTTYRIQFNKEFTFTDFQNIIPYLHQLGITTIYASPVFVAVPGSAHGYDVTNPHEINPEIGTLEQLRHISATLRSHGIGWLQDIVPNHMAYDTHNAWLMDVLKHGQMSKYAPYFDVDWNHPVCPGKIMLPILDKSNAEAISQKELTIIFDNGALFLDVKGNRYPLQDLSVEALFQDAHNIAEQITNINNDEKKLLSLANEQHYYLCPWQDADRQINYRRFFTINGMICLNIQNEKVFDDYHKFIRQLLEEDIFQGLRVDHVDGLYDPSQYLERLRQLAGPEKYITVEKILEPGESLPAYWPVQGTTGYDFISMVNRLLVLTGSDDKLSTFYKNISGDKTRLYVQLADKKKLILDCYMQGELDNLFRLFASLVPGEVFDEKKMKEALSAFLVQCPVYRFYSNTIPLDELEITRLKDVFNKVRLTIPACRKEIDLLEDILLLPPHGMSQEIAHFFKRCMQFSGPLMAKGVEDTLMYTYNRELSRNEVGDSPAASSTTVDEFHRSLLMRKRLWPLTMNTTATHDTKRGEDARARLQAISDDTDAWLQAINRWFDINQAVKTNGIPDSNDEYFIYQSLVAHHPMPGQPIDDFSERFKAYIQKALREAKVYTNWSAPNTNYEDAVLRFIDAILSPGAPFMQDFGEVFKRIAEAGIINGLTQMILKCTSPGIADMYQGCELWDLSMVDPDNRRAVNYDLRQQWLDETLQAGHAAFTKSLWENRYTGQIKLRVLNRLLQARRKNKVLFSEGSYIPLRVKGKYKDHIIAYARCLQSKWLVVVLPLNTSAIGSYADIDWEDTAIEVHNDMPVLYDAILSLGQVHAREVLKVGELFRNIPLAILTGEKQGYTRSAGVLLPVFSLQSAFGIGDFGRGAKEFIDFLKQSDQRYWQILPLNPVEGGGLYSPYSSVSSMALNTLHVSPEMLLSEMLIERSFIDKYTASNGDKVDYQFAEKFKQELWDVAYSNFLANTYTRTAKAFHTFCLKEQYWLNDYALYAALKTYHNNKPWFEWGDEYKHRNKKALISFEKQNNDAINKIKWMQFITDWQWKQLKEYCNDQQVSIFGDIPFYVSHDSVDVWSNPGIFCIDRQGKIEGIAGVPPDYFSADGQLWGVPTYNWESIRKTNYKWWIDRLRRNYELFNVVRIDHFRAIESYWEVPAGERTAINGQWKKGPGMDFFNALRKKLGNLPVVAEDLGYEMEDVYMLREKARLPGMKVLQFAWGENIKVNVDIPHNYTANCVVYTGTHDNNTTRGWFKNETSDTDRKRLAEYTGRSVDATNIHNVLSALAYGSVARIAILPMQDLLGLGEEARINTPGSVVNNWEWRLPKNALSNDIAQYLCEMTHRYNRI